MSGESSRATQVEVPPLEVQAAPASLRQRGRMRSRVRYLRQLREIQLRDLGGFLLELHRFSRRRPELVDQKLADAAETDRELRALESSLGERRPLRELREAGLEPVDVDLLPAGGADGL